MTVMRMEGIAGRLLTFPHPFRSQFPTYLYMLLANRKISNGPYIPRRCSTREGAGGGEGGREGGREGVGREGKSPVQGYALSLSLLPRGRVPGIYCFLFSVFLFGLLTSFGGSWYVSSTSPFSLPE